MTSALWILAGLAVLTGCGAALWLVLRRIDARIPPPTTFVEGQRALYGSLAAAAGMFCGVCSLSLIALLMWGGWSRNEEHTIVVIFGAALAGFIAAMSAVIVGLLVGGPVGRFKASGTKDGVEFEAEGDN